MAYPQGTRLGPYEVTGFMSAGGMGEVYEAHDPRLDRRVAIKVLPPALAELEEFRRRFEQETHAISRLNHKNICTIFDTGTHDGRPYIVMELLEGRTLEEALREGPLPPEQVIHVGIQVADALDAAHRGGVIHRDVKNANIFLNARGDAKVLDFGIAKVAAEADAAATLAKPPITNRGMPVGTVAFMSPEQARGEEVDARSDLFSLGVVLYEMATGVSPFRGTTTSIIAQLVSPDPVTSPRSVQPAIPGGLERVICRALEKDRAMRYQTAADVLAALRGVRRDLTTATSLPSLAVSRPPARSLRSWGGMVGTVLTVLVVALGWQVLGPGASMTVRPIHSMAVLPCAERQVGSDRGYLCALLAERIATSLDKVPGLVLSSLQAVAPYSDDERGAMGIGKDLKVDAVLTAEARLQGDNVHVSVEVTDVRTGARVWGRPYSRPSEEAEEMPELIALDVAENIQLRLTEQERAEFRVHQTYQKAQYFLDDRTAASLEKAIVAFNDVVAVDSSYVDAYVGLANAYTLRHYYGDLRPIESYPMARAAAERALRLDEANADAHAIMGLVKRDFDRDWDGAEREFRRALQLDDRSVNALQWYAELLAMTGRFEAAEDNILRARDVDALNLTVRAVHGWILMSAGRFDEARVELDRVIAMKNDFPLSHWFLGQLAFAKGDFGGAVDAFDTATVLSDRLSGRVADLAAAEARAGDGKRADELLRELERRERFGEYVSQYDFAVVFAGLGQLDRAIEELRGALEERTWQVMNMAIDPMLNPLRGDRRFAELLLRAGFPPT